MLPSLLKTLRFPRLPVLPILGLAMIASLLFSCLSDPKEKTELQFKLDKTLVGQFDSVKVSLYPKGQDTGKALYEKTFALSPNQSTITLELPESINQEFSAIITGIKGGAIAFEKRYDYSGENKAPDSAIVDLKGARDSVEKARQDSLLAEANKGRSVILADSLNCEVGDSVAAKVTIKPDTASDKTFSLTSLDTVKAGVSGKILFCRDTGMATIEVRAHRDTVRASFRVGIVAKVIPLQSISLGDQAAKIGDTLALEPVLKPDDATDKEITATAGDTTIARVLSGLRLLALKAGTTDITLQAKRGPASHAFAFSVSSRSVNPESISIADTQVVIFDTLTPLASYAPSETTERDYTLASSDTSVAAVAGKRLIGKGLGVAIIRIEAASGGAKDSFSVTVRDPAFADIQPITKTWCGKCHSPTITFNLQDSTVLVGKGSQAMRRLALPLGDKDRMPADTVMNPSHLSQLQRWLSIHVRPLLSLSAHDTLIALGDTVKPVLAFDPADATTKDYTLSSENSAVAKVVGQKLVGLALGTAKITATSLDGGRVAEFTAKVAVPGFIAHIKPITADKCGKCHGPAVTFNLQDSTVLLLKGSEAMRRIQLPKDNKDHMPTEGELSPSQLTMLMGWLTAYFVPLQDVTIANDTLKIGETKFARPVFVPPNASNQAYSLLSFDSTKLSLTGLFMKGVAAGAVPMGLTTDEGKKSKTFTVTVIPWPVDSLRGADTSLQVGDSVLPRVQAYPEEATSKAYTLASLDLGLATVLASGKVKAGSTLGNARIVATSTQNPAVKDTFTVAIGPVPVVGVSAANMSLLVGATASPVLTWNPASATNKGYTLSLAAGSTAVATLTAGNTQLAGSTAGTGTYVITTTDGAKVDTFDVNVGNVLATQIDLTHGGIFYAGFTYAPTVAWTPANTTVKTYGLSTNTGGIISHPTATTFKTLALGTGKVIATATDGPKDTLTVTVFRPPFSTVSAVLYNKCYPCHLWSTSPTAYTAADSTLSVTYKTSIVNRITGLVTPQMPPAANTQLTSAEIQTLQQYFGW